MNPPATHLYEIRLTSGIIHVICTKVLGLVCKYNVLPGIRYPLLSVVWRSNSPHHSCCTPASHTPNRTHTPANTSTSHLHTEPPEVSTFWDGKQAWELLSNAAQASGITGAHYMTLPPLQYTHIHIGRAVNISNIFPFPLAGRQQSCRSSQEQSPSRVMICYALHTPREMTHRGRCHCVWGTDWGPWSSTRRWSLGWRAPKSVGRSGLQRDGHF